MALFPVVTGVCGFLVTTVIDHDREITVIKATAYTKDEAAEGRDRVTTELKGVIESVHRIELRIAEQHQQLSQEMRDLFKDK